MLMIINKYKALCSYVSYSRPNGCWTELSKNILREPIHVFPRGNIGFKFFFISRATLCTSANIYIKCEILHDRFRTEFIFLNFFSLVLNVAMSQFISHVWFINLNLFLRPQALVNHWYFNCIKLSIVILNIFLNMQIH